MRSKDDHNVDFPTLKEYCVYYTMYSGEDLPPFYIGSTSTKKVLGGYNGSVTSKKYKEHWEKELKNNPHLFKTVIIGTYDTRQDALDAEKEAQIECDVVKNEDYINMAIACSGFFHGNKHSEESKEQMRESRKKYLKTPKGIQQIKNDENLFRSGHIPWNKDIEDCFDEEAIKSISDSLLKYYEENDSACIGRIKSEKEVQNIKDGLQSMSEEAKINKIESQRISQKETWKNKTKKEDQKRRDKISKAQSGRTAMRDLSGSKKWVNKEDYKSKIKEGWIIGWK